MTLPTPKFSVGQFVRSVANLRAATQVGPDLSDCPVLQVTDILTATCYAGTQVSYRCRLATASGFTEGHIVLLEIELEPLPE